MKKIVLFIMISTLSLFALGEEIHDFKYETSYYTAHKKAKAENKVLLIMMHKHGCPNCGYMKNIVFEKADILNYLNENYVVTLLNVNQRNYPKRFISPRAPTFFFLDPTTDKEIREHKVGGSRPEKFLEELTAVKDAFDNHTTIEEAQKEKPEEAPLSSVIRIEKEAPVSTKITH